MKRESCFGFFRTMTALACGFLIFSVGVAHAELVVEKPVDKKKEEIEKKVFVHSPADLYAEYATVLKKYVDDQGMVDYKGLKEDRKALDDFILSLSKVQLEDYRNWYDNDKLALWLNAYNAFTLKLIVDNYPIKSSFALSMLYPKNSIRQIPNVWNEHYLRIVNFSMTLTDILDKVLRDQFQDPRIHLALVSASLSCALLRQEPYNGDTIDQQLKEQGERFLAKESNFRIDHEKKVAYLPMIFKWYSNEFALRFKGKELAIEIEERVKATLEYISKHIKNEKDIAFIMKEKYQVEYIPYDWTLNERKQ